MTISVNFVNSEADKADSVVVGIYTDNRLSPSAERFDKNLGSMLSSHLQNQKKFSGKEGQSLVMPLAADNGYNRIVLIGLGDPEKLDKLSAQTIGGKTYIALNNAGSGDVSIFIDDDLARKEISSEEMTANIGYGFKLRSYKFDRYKTENKENDKTEIKQINLVTDSYKGAKKIYNDLGCIAEGVFLARDLVNEPPNTLYPESFAQIIKDELKPLGVDVEVIDEKKMQKLSMEAILSVGKGSERQPRMVIMRWNGSNKESQPLAFIGKGVTFDTGGISIKPAANLDEMKLDMGGAAAVTGLIKSLALRKAKVNVVGVVGLAENMLSHNSYRPGDIIGSLSGKTIEVLNTDAEGRLVLADALTYAQRTYKPRLIIDLATLTGAMMVALGYDYCGTFVNDDKMWGELENASATSGENLWRMPLDEVFRKAMTSTIADLRNLSTMGRFAGACTAAGFLERFIEDETPWAHMDIAGTAWIKSEKPTVTKPGTGFGVRILNDFIASNYEDKS